MLPADPGHLSGLAGAHQKLAVSSSQGKRQAGTLSTPSPATAACSSLSTCAHPPPRACGSSASPPFSPPPTSLLSVLHLQKEAGWDLRRQPCRLPPPPSPPGQPGTSPLPSPLSLPPSLPFLPLQVAQQAGQQDAFTKSLAGFQALVSALKACLTSQQVICFASQPPAPAAGGAAVQSESPAPSPSSSPAASPAPAAGGVAQAAAQAAAQARGGAGGR